MLLLLYHIHHNQYQEDIPFWLGLAKQTGGRVLELGCGTGRVLIPLAEAGYRTVGIDNNLSMLRFLQANIKPDLRHAPLLVAADITRFSMETRFPLVILPCNTFSTLEAYDRKDCLSSIRRCLCPGGIFAVSMPNPTLLKKLPSHSEAELEEEFIHPKTGNPVQVSSGWQRSKNTVIVTWTYDHLLPDGLVEHYVATTIHQMTSLETYIDNFLQAGLCVTETYGDFDRSSYTEDSPHLIVLAILK